MGKGLIPSGGKHIAYAAGTGVLVFIDLVSHLILKKVAEQGGPDVLAMCYKDMPDVPRLPDDFFFELQLSSMQPSETIGIELIEALESLDPEKKSFANELMLKSDKDGNKNPNYLRWDEAYYNKLFKDLEATKVWCCGPPIMQECFDRAKMTTTNSKVEFAAL
jgi:hypothetical protein